MSLKMLPRSARGTSASTRIRSIASSRLSIKFCSGRFSSSIVAVIEFLLDQFVHALLQRIPTLYHLRVTRLSFGREAIVAPWRPRGRSLGPHRQKFFPCQAREYGIDGAFGEFQIRVMLQLL